MSGKTAVVTGASRGLGYVTAFTLAKKGAEVILLNRKSAKGDGVFNEIAEVASGLAPKLVECDLLDFEDVALAAARIKDICAARGIDALVLNAGIMMQEDKAGKDGFDITVTTNVLSHFLLTRELMPELGKAADLRGEARVVSMSSGSGFGPPAFNPMFFERKGGNLGGHRASYERYHQSKLANLIFTSALHGKLSFAGSDVKALACTPGVCGTDMFAHVQSIMKPGRPVDLSTVPSVEDGALAQLKCICDPSVSSGELYGPPGMGGLPVKIPLAQPTVLVNEQDKAELWKACELAVGPFEVPSESP